MPRSRPASNPISYHKPTGQYYVTRGGKRVYLGADHRDGLDRFHRLALGTVPQQTQTMNPVVTAKELANRFLAAQQANWRNPRDTLASYQQWLGRFLRDHPGLRADDLSVEMFAAWKLSLRNRGYQPKSINHFLSAVRAMYSFGEETGVLQRSPRLTRVKNESRSLSFSNLRPVCAPEEITRLLEYADPQMRVMILLGLNCAFGPKDLQDVMWQDIEGERLTLPRSKTGVAQTFLLWPESVEALRILYEHRRRTIARLLDRGRERSDAGHVFVTKFWHPWTKDAVSEPFQKLCDKAGVRYRGFDRLRHSASTAMSLVSSPHVQRRFMRHTQLQQQVTYTHIPDSEVDEPIMKARRKLLGDRMAIANSGTNREPEKVASIE